MGSNKTPYTLLKDINHVLTTGEGWTDEISRWVADDIAKSFGRQFSPRGERARTLRASNLGTPCRRKLWYHINSDFKPQSLPASTLNKFIFGDITESYILGLCKAAGHDVTGLQDPVVVCGIRGSRDCVIDGMLFDVKSASSRSFDKFASGRLRDSDDFGYISQLSTYLFGSLHDPLVTEKSKAGFLAFDKQHGHIAVDIHDLSEDLRTKEADVEAIKKGVLEPDPPPRPYEPVPQGKRKNPETGKQEPDYTGNMKLAANCSYCDYKYTCWDKIRTFMYSSGPVFLTKVVREPNVFEVDKA